MMSQKMVQSPTANTADNDKPPGPSLAECSTSIAPGRRNKPSVSQRNGEATSSSPESGSLNGDGKRSGKSRRRKKRGANPEEKVDRRAESADKPRSPPARLTALQAERANVWFERSVYERAESIYQCWLANSSGAAAKMNNSTPGPASTAASQASSGRLCHHGDQVACHHLVQDVWVNKANFDQAERRFVREAMQRNIPNSLDLQAAPQRSVVAGTPDEGYQSQVPTPATPVVPQAAAALTTLQPINGLPRIPVELLRDVWLEKPQYDRAEAAFYQNLHGNNASKRAGCASASRSGDHPQSLAEEEEEEEEERAAAQEKQAAPQVKAEAFHALQPIQEEEEEPAEIPDKVEAPGPGSRYFLHPDSERVWLDKWRYDAAESRFHGAAGRRQQGDASAARSGDNNMSAVNFLSEEKIWFEKPRYDEAERRFYENLNGSPQTTQDVGANTILQDIARARENIQKSLAGLKTTLCNRGSVPPAAASHRAPLSSNNNNNSSGSSNSADQGELLSRISNLELESQTLHKVVENLRVSLSKLECWVVALEKSNIAAMQAPAAAAPSAIAPAAPAAPSVPYTNGTTAQPTSGAPEGGSDDEDEDDFDLFGSDEDDEEAERMKEERLKEYAERKAKKPAVIAKSSILLDVKPWDDETDMAKLEECVRSVQVDGLLWGASKLLPVGYGIKKLQISCVVEDDKVGTDLLEEEITKFEDYVQSVDVAAFNKI